MNTCAYDGDNLIETVNTSGAVVARYSQELNVDEPLAELRGTATDYYEADGLGSTTSLSDKTGARAQTYTYDSFGNTVATTGSLRNYFQYTGRESDPETSLYYYRARYYDPMTGRFFSEDPKHFKAGVNFYRYVNNNPVLLSDPKGACPLQQQQCSELQTIVQLTGALAAANLAAGVVTAGLPPVSATLGTIAAVEGVASGVFAIVWVAFCY